jgi:hypothetical protein
MAGEPVKTGGLTGRRCDGLLQHGRGAAAAWGLGDLPDRPNEPLVGQAQNVVASPPWAIELSVGRGLQVVGSPQEHRDFPGTGTCVRRPGRHTRGLVIPRARSDRHLHPVRAGAPAFHAPRALFGVRAQPVGANGLRLQRSCSAGGDLLVDCSGSGAQKQIPRCPSPRRGANARDDILGGIFGATARDDILNAALGAFARDGTMKGALPINAWGKAEAGASRRRIRRWIAGEPCAGIGGAGPLHSSMADWPKVARSDCLPGPFDHPGATSPAAGMSDLWPMGRLRHVGA